MRKEIFCLTFLSIVVFGSLSTALCESLTSQTETEQSCKKPGPEGKGMIVPPNYLVYLHKIKDIFRERWWMELWKGQKPQATIKFKINKSGSISNLRLDQASNNEKFNSSILRSASTVTSLPSPPIECLKDFDEVTIVFDLNH